MDTYLFDRLFHTFLAFSCMQHYVGTVLYSKSSLLTLVLYFLAQIVFDHQRKHFHVYLLPDAIKLFFNYLLLVQFLDFPTYVCNGTKKSAFIQLLKFPSSSTVSIHISVKRLVCQNGEKQICGVPLFCSWVLDYLSMYRQYL